MIFADRIVKRMDELRGNVDGDTGKKVTLQLRITALSENIAARFRTSPNEDKPNYNFAITLLTQALVHANNGDKTNAQKLMSIARRVAK